MFKLHLLVPHYIFIAFNFLIEVKNLHFKTFFIKFHFQISIFIKFIRFQPQNCLILIVNFHI